MRNVLLILALLLGASTVAAAASPREYSVTADGGTRWTATIFPLTMSDWTQENGDWVLNYGGSLFVDSPSTISALDVVFVHNGQAIFSLDPFIAPGGMSMGGQLRASAPGNDALVLVTATDTGATNARIAIGGPDDLSHATDVAPSASGATGGATMSSASTPAALLSHEHAEHALHGASPIWYSGELTFEIDCVGAGTVHASSTIDGTTQASQATLVAPSSSLAGVAAGGRLTNADLAINYDGLAEAGTTQRVAEVALTFDPSTLGISDTAWHGTITGGSGPFAVGPLPAGFTLHKQLLPHVAG